jgi:hypothetical protein
MYIGKNSTHLVTLLIRDQEDLDKSEKQFQFFLCQEISNVHHTTIFKRF